MLFNHKNKKLTSINIHYWSKVEQKVPTSKLHKPVQSPQIHNRIISISRVEKIHRQARAFLSKFMSFSSHLFNTDAKKTSRGITTLL